DGLRCRRRLAASPVADLLAVADVTIAAARAVGVDLAGRGAAVARHRVAVVACLAGRRVDDAVTAHGGRNGAGSRRAGGGGGGRQPGGCGRGGRRGGRGGGGRGRAGRGRAGGGRRRDARRRGRGGFDERGDAELAAIDQRVLVGSESIPGEDVHLAEAGR